MILAGSLFVIYAAASAVVAGAWLPALFLASLAAAFVAGRHLDERSVWINASWLGVFALPLVWWVELNPNYLGCAAVLLMAGCLVHRYWLNLPWLFGALVYSQSRGAIIAFGLMCAMWLGRRAPVVAFALVCAAILILVNADRGGSSMWHRLGVWQDTLNAMTLFGHGLGSFADWYAGLARHTNWSGGSAHAYNDFLELVFELGVGVIPLWIMLVLAWEADAPGQKLILLTFGALGLTYFPLFIPVLGHLAAFTLGSLSVVQAPSRASLGAFQLRRLQR